MNSPEYRKADDLTKRKALDLSPKRINGALLREGLTFQLTPQQLLFDAADAQERKRIAEQLRR